MKALGIFLSILVAGSALAAPGTGQQPQTQQANAHDPLGTAQPVLRRGTFAVEITMALNVEKLKVGDEVPALLEQNLMRNGKVFAAVGAKVRGHVTAVKALTPESPESRLQVVFDSIVADGQEIVFAAPAIVQALAPEKNGLPSRSTVRGRRDEVVMPDTVSARSFQPAIRGGQREQGGRILTPEAHGALYLEDVELKDGPEGAVVVAHRKNLKLGYGTQMEIVIPEPAK